MVRESDKSEEIYFEKGQTRQLVEQWKIKQASPERESAEAPATADTEVVQQGERDLSAFDATTSNTVEFRQGEKSRSNVALDRQRKHAAA